jgi:two-component sensor histidine kinase
LRAVLAICFGGLGLIAALASSLAVAAVADRRIRADIGAEFTAAAERVADLLDRGLFERLRDVQVAASLEAIADPKAPPASRQAVLRRLQETYPDYAILFFIGPDGRIQSTSSGILVGTDVSRREYFRRGMEQPFVADVHDGKLMAPVLGRGPENIPRFVDLSAPVRAADGTLVGVVAAHLFWEWAEGIERHVMRPLLMRHPGAEAIVFSRDGEVLLGPPGLAITSLPDAAPDIARELAAGRSGSRVETFQDGAGSRRYLVGYAATRGHRSYAGLGWTVMVRRDVNDAFAPAHKLFWEVMVWGVAAAALAAALGWLLAGLVSRPLKELSKVAERLRDNAKAAEVPTGRGPREVVSLSHALAALVAGVRWREAALRDGEARLQVATEGAGIGTWELDLASGRSMRSPRHDAIFGHVAPLPEWTFATFTHHLAPEDRAAVAEVFQQAVATKTEWCIECRIRHAGAGEERWIQIRGVPLSNPDTGDVSRYSGVVEDITGRKEGERALQLLVRELDHRVKNQFAVFDSLVQFTARAAPDTESLAKVLRSRVRALAAAHDLVRDAAGDGLARGLQPTTLAALLEAILRPFGVVETGPAHPLPYRVHLAGPDVVVGPGSASAMALVAHELATNAARHGALSAPTGVVDVSWAVTTTELQLVWRETGGPAVASQPEQKGFGTALIHQGVKAQLGGRATFNWSRIEGLSVLVEIPMSRLAH